MKYTTAILSSLLATVAVAQPHVRHQHAARHEKRDVVWETEWDYVTETVDFTTTVWVSAGAQVPTTSAAHVQTTLATSPRKSIASSKPATSTVASSLSQGGEFNESPSSTFVAPTTSAYVAPTTSSTSVYVAPTPSSSSSVYVAPVVSTSSSVAPVIPSISVPVIVPTTSSSSTYVPPSTTTTPTSTGTSSGSGSEYTGDITFYAAGLGSCGETTDGATFKGVALPAAFMGAQSNGNPYCGKTIKITCPSTGKSTTATVIDKCPGCSEMSIDLTNAAFDELADESVGRTTAIWSFVD